MKANEPTLGQKGLVAVFEDLETAKQVIEKIHQSGFALDKIELVAKDVEQGAPELFTPQVHETTETLLFDSAGKWGGAGLLAGLLTGNPVLAVGMAAMGGMTGAFVGGMAGVDQAVQDDAVNLPTLSEYEQMVRNGRCLVVLLGKHDEVLRAEASIHEFPDIHRHLHVLHGHEFHEHPTVNINHNS